MIQRLPSESSQRLLSFAKEGAWHVLLPELRDRDGGPVQAADAGAG